VPRAARAGALLSVLWVLDVACVLAAEQAEPGRARRWLDQSDALYRRAGLQRDPADAAFLARWRQPLAAAPAPAQPLAVDEPLPHTLQRVADWLDAVNPSR